MSSGKRKGGNKNFYQLTNSLFWRWFWPNQNKKIQRNDFWQRVSLISEIVKTSSQGEFIKVVHKLELSTFAFARDLQILARYSANLVVRIFARKYFIFDKFS